MRTAPSTLSDAHTTATTQNREVDILDVEMSGILGEGPGNTLRNQTPETQRSVLAMLDFHTI